MRSRLLPVVLLVIVVAGDGCGGSSPSGSGTVSTRTVETTSVESGIKDQLSNPETKVTSAKCPSTVKAGQGSSFTCSVSWDNGATGKVKVTQRAPNHYTYEPVEGSVQVPGATVEKSIQEELAKQGAPHALVNCPDNIIVKLDTTVTCHLSTSSGKQAGSVTFSFADAGGTVDSSSVKTSA